MVRLRHLGEKYAVKFNATPSPDPEQQRTDDDLLRAINQVAQFFYFGNGAPTFTPTNRAIYVRLNGGAGTTLYCYSGAAWAAFA